MSDINITLLQLNADSIGLPIWMLILIVLVLAASKAWKNFADGLAVWKNSRSEARRANIEQEKHDFELESNKNLVEESKKGLIFVEKKE